MKNVDEMSVNAIRVLSAEAIQKAKSGHPGLPLGAAPTAYESQSGESGLGKQRPLYSLRRTRFYVIVFFTASFWLWKSFY